MIKKKEKKWNLFGYSFNKNGEEMELTCKTFSQVPTGVSNTGKT